MLIKNLFETVILEPAQQDADALYIIAGFASAAFATDCLSEFKTYSTSQRRVQLILGMTPFVPNMQAQHNAFKELANTHYPAQFECRYIIKAPYVHIKAYAWYKQNAPYKGFIGSANYTRQAFRGKQRECVEFASPVEILSAFNDLWNEAIDCISQEADDYISRLRPLSMRQTSIVTPPIPTTQTLPLYQGLDRKTLSLLAKASQDVPRTSGLNWGQRAGRNPNQAYIVIPSVIAHSDFFPPLRQHFTAITDDGESLTFVRAQPKQAGGSIGYALQTPLDNSTLGAYLRKRLGVPSGNQVTKQHLQTYGRTDIDFYKIDDETYYLDFSPHKAL